MSEGAPNVSCWQVYSTLWVWLRIKQSNNADRFPILAVCRARFLDIRTALEENWEAVFLGGNDKRKDPSTFFLSFYTYLLKSNHFDLFLRIYYNSTGVVNCVNKWKSLFFSLPMIADHARA